MKKRGMSIGNSTLIKLIAIIVFAVIFTLILLKVIKIA